MVVEKGGRRLAGPHRGMVDEPAEEAEVGRRPGDAGRAESAREVVERLLARLPVRAQLGDQRVVGDRDLVPGLDAGVDADRVRELEELEAAGLREEGQRVLGVEPHLDRVALGLARLEAERLAGRDPQLLLDEVEPGHELRHRMLDLEPRVQLQEEEALAVEHELGGAGVLVADRPRERHRGLAHRGPQLGVERGEGLSSSTF